LTKIQIEDFQDFNALNLETHIEEIFTNCKYLDTMYTDISKDIVNTPILKNFFDYFLHNVQYLKEKKKFPLKIQREFELIPLYKIDNWLFKAILKYLRDTLS